MTDAPRMPVEDSGEHTRPTCLLVDDHETVRASLAALLVSEGYEIVGEAGTAAQAVGLMETHRPVLAVLDYGLPDRNGLAVAREVARVSPGTRIVLYTGEATPTIVRDALAVGVHAIVQKDVPPVHLLRAIDAVLGGELYVDPTLAHDASE
jgi:DNA-binding NarL/FixJ family response regulator